MREGASVRAYLSAVRQMSVGARISVWFSMPTRWSICARTFALASVPNARHAYARYGVSPPMFEVPSDALRHARIPVVTALIDKAMTWGYRLSGLVRFVVFCLVWVFGVLFVVLL